MSVKRSPQMVALLADYGVTTQAALLRAIRDEWNRETEAGYTIRDAEVLLDGMLEAKYQKLQSVGPEPVLVSDSGWDDSAAIDAALAANVRATVADLPTDGQPIKARVGLLSLADCVASGQHGLFLSSGLYHEHAPAAADSNRQWSWEQRLECAECGHLPGDVPDCECCQRAEALAEDARIPGTVEALVTPEVAAMAVEMVADRSRWTNGQIVPKKPRKAKVAAPVLKRCAGVPSANVAAHEAELAAFTKDAKQKDGLSTKCRACGTAYHAAKKATASAVAATA